MLKKDYLLLAVLRMYEKGKTVVDVREWLGLDEMVLMAIEDVYDTGEKWGHTLTGLDVITFYKSGLTFSEVAWIKGVTKEAIRSTVDSILIVAEKEQAKWESRENRIKMRDVILYDGLVLEVARIGMAAAIEKTGYNEKVFKRMYRESVAWKVGGEGNKAGSR